MLEAFIAERRAEILSELNRRMTGEQPGVSARELMAEVPDFLDALREVLSGAKPLEATVDELTARQGRQRQRLGMSPAFVAKTYGLMCEVISNIASKQGLEIPARDVEVMNELIDIGTSAALNAYWKQAMQEPRRPERISSHLRELQRSLASARVAFQAIQAGRVGNRSRTASALEQTLDRMEELLDRALTDAEPAPSPR